MRLTFGCLFTCKASSRAVYKPCSKVCLCVESNVGPAEMLHGLCRPLKQLLAQFLARQPGEVAAAVRTTVAATGVTTHPAAGNVLPSLASAQLNFRYLPGLPPSSLLFSTAAMT